MKMRKTLALALSATMTMGIAMPVMAADPPAVTAPIYSFETIDVIVPTTYKVAFNPEGLTVKTGDSATSTDQILSKNYGILNKSNKDMLCTVALKVEDKNTGDNKVEFVNSAADVTNAKDGEYKIYLTAVPADGTEVQVGSSPASADKSTNAAALDEVTMTGATSAAVTLKAGDNMLAFKLNKATYKAVSGSEVTLGSSTQNDVSASYEIDTVAASGKGITAFTFGGSMNANADWTKIQSGIEITPVYTQKVAGTDTTVINGTGAMVKIGPQVSVSATGLITMTGFTADENYKSATLTNSGGTFDINAAEVEWNLTQFSETTGGSITGQLGTAWMDSLRGGTGTLVVTLSTGDEITATISIPAATE